jgi:glycosyltransferase involved in cell wall biosynthesis
MAKRKKSTPDFVFESGWEVCNKVGGIYTVMSTKARTLQEMFEDSLVFIGPDLWANVDNPDFKESKTIFKEWKKVAAKEGLTVRTGRWNIEGKPIAVLVDYQKFFEQKNEIYTLMWEKFGVESLNANGDYDDCAMFSIAVGKTIESLYNFLGLEKKKVVAQFHEWSLGMALLYLKACLPAITTVFTTHATTVGRSICFNNKPLYSQFENYDGDTMARELNIEAKHSLEKQAAHNADCFTTVSSLTANECRQLLGKHPDIVTPNGIEADMMPDTKTFETKRKKARKKLLEVARQTGAKISSDALFIATSGRYEYRNKGIDLFIEAINRVRLANPARDIVALILVPSADCDGKISGYLNYLGFHNSLDEKTKIIIVPTYLNGNDGVFNIFYYDLLTGFDLTVFPSYYEPWGYTPLESIAFGIPTITTNLAGFGLWAIEEGSSGTSLSEGVLVIERNDENYFSAAEEIKNAILDFSQRTAAENESAASAARRLATKADWKRFIKYYLDAYADYPKSAK